MMALQAASLISCGAGEIGKTLGEVYRSVSCASRVISLMTDLRNVRPSRK